MKRARVHARRPDTREPATAACGKPPNAPFPWCPGPTRAPPVRRRTTGPRPNPDLCCPTRHGWHDSHEISQSGSSQVRWSSITGKPILLVAQVRGGPIQPLSVNSMLAAAMDSGPGTYRGTQRRSGASASVADHTWPSRSLRLMSNQIAIRRSPAQSSASSSRNLNVAVFGNERDFDPDRAATPCDPAGDLFRLGMPWHRSNQAVCTVRVAQ